MPITLSRSTSTIWTPSDIAGTGVVAVTVTLT